MPVPTDCANKTKFRPCSTKNYPSDVLLEIVAHLNLNDVLSLLSVCSNFRKLSKSRHLWRPLLARMQKLMPLACPIGTDIAQLDIDTLQRIARHTSRLEQTWRLNKSSSISAMRTIAYVPWSNVRKPGYTYLYGAIPGTSLVVLYYPAVQELACCDVDGVAPSAIAHLSPPYSFRAHCYQPGCYLMAFAGDLDLGPNSTTIQVFSLTYGENQTTRLRQIHRVSLGSPCGLVFISKDIVGHIQLLNARTFLIQASNLVTGITVKSTVECPDTLDATSPFVSCTSADDALSITIVSRGVYRIYHCPPELLPYSENIQWKNGASNGGDLIRIAELNGVEHREHPFSGPMIKLSPNGLHAVLNSADSTHLHFWPTNSFISPPSESLCTSSGDRSPDLVLRGNVQPDPSIGFPPDVFATSPSGAYIAAVLYRNDLADRSVMGAVRELHIFAFSDDHPRVRACRLTVPSYIDLQYIFSIAIEERYGVVYLANIDGQLFVLKYA